MEENNTKKEQRDHDHVLDVSPELIAKIKAEVLEEMKVETKRKEEEDKIRREKEREDHEEYVAQMKISPDPWVEIVGWSESKEGVKIELDWNNAFIDNLQQQGITGADEDQIIQKWIIILMRDLSEEMENKNTPNTQFE